MGDFAIDVNRPRSMSADERKPCLVFTFVQTPWNQQVQLSGMSWRETLAMLVVAVMLAAAGASGFWLVSLLARP
jgi:hypothetical protein